MAKTEGFDDILRDIGFGKWTLFMFLPYLCWASVLPYFSLGGAFYNPVLEHTCSVSALTNNWTYEDKLNASIPWERRSGQWERSRCTIYNMSQLTRSLRKNSSEDLTVEECNSWDYDVSVFEDTVAKEWNLVCNDAGWSPFFQSFYFIGTAFGDSFLGYLSDRYGRRTITRICLTLVPVTSLVLSLSPVYWVVLLCRFVMGVLHASMAIGYVLAMESCPPKYRALVGLSLNAPYAITGIFFGIIAYFCRSWRTLHLICTIPALVALLVVPIMEESSRWLILKKRETEAVSNLKRASRWHGKRVHNENLHIKVMEFQKSQLAEEIALLNLEENGKSCTKEPPITTCFQKMTAWLKDVFELFRSPVLRRISLSMFVCWFASGLSYWGISLAGVNFSNDPFLYMIIGCFVELAGYTSFYPLVKRFGRKQILSVTFFISALTILSIVIIPKRYSTLIFACATIGKLFITSSYNILYLYASELFPTSVRSRGLNFSSMMARLGSILSPFIVEVLALSFWWAPSVVFGGCALVGAIVALMLPESKGKPLADTVEQFEIIYG